MFSINFVKILFLRLFGYFIYCFSTRIFFFKYCGCFELNRYSCFGKSSINTCVSSSWQSLSPFWEFWEDAHVFPESHWIIWNMWWGSSITIYFMCQFIIVNFVCRRNIVPETLDHLLYEILTSKEGLFRNRSNFSLILTSKSHCNFRKAI